MIGRSKPRSAFTVLEMLVVIGIIGLLASITVSAVFRIQSSQKEKNTNTHLTKIQAAFEEQWKAAVDNIKKENLPDAVRTVTRNKDQTDNIARAKALHMKLGLRREFPQTFTEARQNLNANSQPVVDPYGDPAMFATYGPRAALTEPIKGLTTQGPDTRLESAVLLFLILSQSRGGASQDPQTIAPTELIDISGKQLRVFVDEWGTPIGMRRWALDGAEWTMIGGELNSPPLVAANASNNYDKDDPDGKLMQNSNWLNAANYNLANKYFTTFLPQVAKPFLGQNRGPFVYSSGRDAKPNNIDDDLYSFRLQQFGKGN